MLADIFADLAHHAKLNQEGLEGRAGTPGWPANSLGRAFLLSLPEEVLIKCEALGLQHAPLDCWLGMPRDLEGLCTSV